MYDLPLHRDRDKDNAQEVPNPEKVDHTILPK
jgi:hypothetical protein